MVMTLEKLAEVREKAKKDIYMRKIGQSSIKVTVGMGTCGIAAGAREVLIRFADEIYGGGVENVMLTQTGCRGNCELEPMVTVSGNDGKAVTYVHVTPDKASRIVKEHLIGGKVVTEYTLGSDAE